MPASTEVGAGEALQRACRDDGILQPPAAVSVGDHDVAVSGGFDDGLHPIGVRPGRAPYLELKAADPLGPPGQHIVPHSGGLIERHRDVERKPVLPPAAEQGADGKAGGASQEVPAGHVDGALRVAMPQENRVHLFVDLSQVAGIHADQMGHDLSKGGDGPGAEGREIGRAERTDFAPPDQTGVAGHPDHGAREAGDDAVARHHVATVHIGQLIAENVNGRDQHGGRCCGLSSIEIRWRSGHPRERARRALRPAKVASKRLSVKRTRAATTAAVPEVPWSRGSRPARGGPE